MAASATGPFESRISVLPPNQTLVCQVARQPADLGAGFALRPASMKFTR